MNVYDAIYTRRDIREFRPDPVPHEVLLRMLDAAHHAPSVGFMQPWSFVLVRDLEVRKRVRESFLRENALAAQRYEGERRTLYEKLTLEGILTSALNLCVTCDRTRGGAVLGRNSIPEMDLFSTCLAVQNLWLAGRAEGVGVGWLSIVDPGKLAQLLAIPEGVVPVAYLCVGYPREFAAEPMLQTSGWRERLPLRELVFSERYGEPEHDLFDATKPSESATSLRSKDGK